jgi:RimJ/RimL family protein N-acetyltransferase
MFEGKLTVLRGLELSDLDDIVEGFNYYPMRRYLAAALPVSRGQEESWIKSTWARRQEGSAYVFAIDIKSTKEFIGTISLESVSTVNRCASFGIAIYREKNWSQGYGTDAIKVILSLGFDILNLHSINLQVHPFNTRGIKCYEKAGFKEVGRYRDYIYLEGNYHDSILMDILKDEYVELASNDDTWPVIKADE